MDCVVHIFISFCFGYGIVRPWRLSLPHSLSIHCPYFDFILFLVTV
ncbi:hypothetical protein AMTRI_Chr12g273090 [Amborella trichopoda]